jgi:broad specificity phosphatase PhoE
MRLYIIRHGQTDWNRTGVAQGQTDVPLNDLGLRQAEALAEAFPTDLGWVLSSDLGRCRQTIAPVADQLPNLRYDSLLRERAFGEFEGRPFIEWFVTMPSGSDPIQSRPSGGESVMDVWYRVVPIVNEVQQMHLSGAIITHGMTAGVLLAHLIHGTPHTSRAFRFGNTSITELERRQDGTFVLLKFNDTRHLEKLEQDG